MEDYKINWLQPIYADKLSHYWYGGDVAEIDCPKGVTVKIAAIGDVRVNFVKVSKDTNELKTLVSFTDKNNAGLFTATMIDFIPDDSALMRAASAGLSQEEDFLEVFNNNWWSIEIFRDGEYLSGECSDYGNLFDAIPDAIYWAKEIIADLEEV